MCMEVVCTYIYMFMYIYFFAPKSQEETCHRVNSPNKNTVLPNLPHTKKKAFDIIEEFSVLLYIYIHIWIYNLYIYINKNEQ